MIKVKIIEFKKSQGQIIDLDSKYAPDYVIQSASISYEVDGCKCGQYVNTDSYEKAVEQVIESVAFNELVHEKNPTFKEVGLEEPFYETEEGENGYIELLEQFVYASDIFIKNKRKIKEDIKNKAVDMYRKNIHIEHLK